MLTFPAPRLLRVVSLAFALTACGGEDGPSETDKDDTTDETKDAGDNKRDSSKPDANVQKDSGPPPDRDASSGDDKLDALRGRYLMRWDVLGTATSPNPLGELKIRSRLSTMVVAELSVKDGKLVSSERICTQVAAQKCLEDSCEKASTTVDSRVITNFLKMRKQERSWSVAADGTVKGEESAALLGWDGDADEALPTENTDERVWDVDTSTPAREGFLTKIAVTLGLPINCTAFGTQKYVSILEGKFDGSETSAVELDLNVDPSDATTLPTGNAACDSQGMMAKSPIDKTRAQIVRYGDDLSDDEFWNCPAVTVFNEKMSATEPELDKP